MHFSTPDPRDGVPMLQMVTPLPPVATGIAQYAADLLSAVDGSWRVNVFAEDGFVDPRWSTVRVRGRHRRRTLNPQVPTILHVGNSAFHELAYTLARKRGAIVVLHDVVLHFGRLAEFLKRGRSSEYKREMRARYGEEGARFAAQLLAGRRPESFVEFPLCEEFVERSAATVVHSDYARDLVKRFVPDANVYRVPMGVPLPALMDRSEMRSALGIMPDAFVIASITHVNPFKRLPIVLEAMRHVVREVPQALLVIAGSVAPGIDLEGHISRLGLQRNVQLVGYVSDDYARMLARAADVAVNLRYPSAGETSASLLRLLGAGIPVIVTDDESTSEYDTEGVLRVPVDVGEIEAIAETFIRLATDHSECESRGHTARSFIEREHSMAVSVAAYRAVIAAVSGQSLPDVSGMVVDEPPPVFPPIELRGAEIATFFPWEVMAADALIALRLDGQDDTIEALARAMADLRLDGPREDPRTGGTMIMDDAPIRAELLEILACPACKGEIELHDQELACKKCGRHYRIENGIPLMIAEDEAE